MSAAAADYPLLDNGALYDPAQAEEYLSMLFRHVDWQPGQVISLLGIGEKGTDREGVFKERKIIAPAFIGAMHGHLKRWAEWHAAGFIVPAVLHQAAQAAGDVTLDKVAALTAIILDLDSGDVSAKAAWVTERLGKPTMTVASGGSTEEKKLKAHLYWLFNEPCDDIERVAAIRKLLAAKVGGDQSFGRATQVIRVPGSVHAKNGKAQLCRILDRNDIDYSFDELAEIVEEMAAMPGLPAQETLPAIKTVNGLMDFAPRLDTATAALHRDVHEGGDEITRWGEFSKVAGFNISEVRAGRLTPEAAYTAANGWMLEHMIPPWPQARFDQEFNALVQKDIAGHGPFPIRIAGMHADPATPLPLIYFSDIRPSLTNNWLARDYLPLPGLVLFYGAPGSGKSFLAVDTALRIAAGWDIDGRAVQKMPVIYIAAEGARGLQNRVAAFRQAHSVSADIDFALVPCAVNLLDPNADLPRLIALAKTAVGHFGQPLGLIVVDTLAATFGGGDENGPAMVGYVNNLAHLRDAFGATVMTIHHRPKDQLNDTPRGHGSLMGAMDTIIRVDGTDVRLASITKQKDAEAGQPLTFGLESVVLGTDEEGEPVRSAVVKYLKAATTDALPRAATEILQALVDAVYEADGHPVLEKTWREKWDAARPETMDDEARRKAWARGKSRLKKSGRASDVGGFWSVATAPIEAIASPLMMNFAPAARAEQ